MTKFCIAFYQSNLSTTLILRDKMYDVFSFHYGFTRRLTVYEWLFHEIICFCLQHKARVRCYWRGFQTLVKYHAERIFMVFHIAILAYTYPAWVLSNVQKRTSPPDGPSFGSMRLSMYTTTYLWQTFEEGNWVCLSAVIQGYSVQTKVSLLKTATP